LEGLNIKIRLPCISLARKRRPGRVYFILEEENEHYISFLNLLYSEINIHNNETFKFIKTSIPLIQQRECLPIN
jgi:hypothetical protein